MSIIDSIAQEWTQHRWAALDKELEELAALCRRHYLPGPAQHAYELREYLNAKAKSVETINEVLDSKALLMDLIALKAIEVGARINE